MLPSHPVSRIDSFSRRLSTAEANLESLAGRLAEQRSHEERIRELERLVNRDPVTGLQIRRQFQRALSALLPDDGTATARTPFAVGVMRLDSSYSRIRNTRDRNRVLLYKTCERVRRVAGHHVYQSERFDEFLVIFPTVPGRDALGLRADALMEAVRKPHAPPASDISFGAYLGVARFPEDGTTSEQLVANAEISLREASQTDRRVTFYTAEMGARYREREQLESDLRQISRTGFADFSLVFQPFVDEQRVIRGAESLVRWRHPQLGPISPGRFIPIAEEGGAIRFLGQWTLYQSCQRIRELPEPQRNGLYVSVNLSPLQFKQVDLIERIAGILESTGLPARNLNLEVTETIVMDDPEEAIAKMRDIKSLGVRLALDDFGTGYSSLSYLRRFEFDTLKIDRSFVVDVDRSRSGQELLRTMIGMARAFGMKSLAEGVEREEELAFLWSEGCDLVQGYYFSPPVPWTDFRDLLDRGIS